MIFVALGSNLPSRYGAPLDTIFAAMRAMDKGGIKVLDVSRIWRTAPVPVSDQPDFYNAVVRVQFMDNAHALLYILQHIEADFGRERSVRNAARPLDLDILAFGDNIITVDGLNVPHPRLHERGFVLFPLRDVAGAWRHPVRRLSVAGMIAALPADQVLSEETAVSVDLFNIMRGGADGV